MNTLKIYQVDSFSNELFRGNPAAICPLDKWLNDELLQNIAAENNLAETAFYLKKGDEYEIRWFTPTVEVDLCGHATLAAAFVIFNFEQTISNTINFYSHRSGKLTVSREDDWFTLNFPSDSIQEISIFPELTAGFNFTPVAVYKGKTDYLLIFNTQSVIEDLLPDFQKIGQLSNCRGVIVSAPGNDCDFVSRFFGPQVGVNEDPVTGSAHTTLTPYWSKKLNKTALSAMQLSSRKGWLKCQDHGERTHISGQARLFLKGEIEIN